MPEYTRSHPWITFSLNLAKAPYSLWLMLGEAQSKCEHLRGAALLPEVSERLHRVSLARGVMGTTAIEGNTLTEAEVMSWLEGRLDLPPSREYLGRELDNIIDACQLIVDTLGGGGERGLTYELICEYNRRVLRGLPLKDGVAPGEVSSFNVGVMRYRGAPRSECKELLTRLCTWINEGWDADPTNRVALGIVKAIVTHLYLAWIHPFGDGNGRTARLLELHILFSIGVPSDAAHLLSNHYNNTRTEYYRQLDMASASGGDVMPFILYALQGFIDGLREHIAVVQEQQTKVLWQRHIYDEFEDKKSATETRRRHLMLDLSERFFETSQAIALSDVRTISVRVVGDYAGMHDRTIQRDVDVLAVMGLIDVTDGKIAPRIQSMKAYLPGFLPQLKSRAAQDRAARV